MIQDVEKIELRSGLLEQKDQISNLPLITLHRADITPEIFKMLRENDILNCGGEYGDRAAGFPVQYDNLRIHLTDDTVEIVFFNRAIALFTCDDEKLRRIHQFMCAVESCGGNARSR